VTLRAALLLAALPLAAGAAGPGGAIVTDQVARLLADGPEAAEAQILALMERIGRADGLVLATLVADSRAATEARIAQAVDSLVALDTGDGVLTRLEVSRARSDWTASHLQTFFEEFDTDGDGRVDRTEIEAGVRFRAEEVSSTAILRDLRTWDLDGDGTVTPEEIALVVRANPVAPPRE
jgi:hypothetical protein